MEEYPFTITFKHTNLGAGASGPNWTAEELKKTYPFLNRYLPFDTITILGTAGRCEISINGGSLDSNDVGFVLVGTTTPVTYRNMRIHGFRAKNTYSAAQNIWVILQKTKPSNFPKKLEKQ